MKYLEKLSAQADVRLLAERREMALLMYEMEQEEARLRGKVEGKAEGEAKGVAEGLVRGKREALLRLLERQGIGLTENQHARIATCNDAALLDQWFDEAFTVTSADELSLCG